MRLNVILISVVGYEGSLFSVYTSTIYRTLEILLGIVVSMFVNICLFPDNTSYELMSKINTLRIEILIFYKNIFSDYFTWKYSKYMTPKRNKVRLKFLLLIFPKLLTYLHEKNITNEAIRTNIQ